MSLLESLANSLWSQGRKCLLAKIDENGDLRSYWGLAEPGKPPLVKLIVFDKHTHLSKSVGLVRLARTVNLPDLKAGRFSLVEQGEISWKTVKVKGTDDSDVDISVPIHAEVYSDQNSMKIELVNRIYWQFGKEVPDSVFVDPRAKEVKEPVIRVLEQETDKPKRRYLVHANKAEPIDKRRSRMRISVVSEL